MLMNKIYEIILIFKNYKLFEIFILGIFSGMPLAIIVITMSAWLTESNVAISVITTFAIARLPYSLKVLWAPIVDHFAMPYVKRLGHRKSWLILCCFLESIILFYISKSSPDTSLHLLHILTIALGTISATFDISVDAFRIERFDKSMQAMAGVSAVFGYRIGVLIAGAGALYFADVTDWETTFKVISGIFIIAIVFILVLKEQERKKIKEYSVIRSMIINPLKDFLTRDKSVIILLAIILFKLGDVMLGSVAMPFYLSLGFTKSQIAGVVKIFGLAATILGSYCGGVIVYKIGNLKGLVITGIVQSITNVSFIWLNHHPGELDALYIAIAIENFTAGMGTAALVGYLSNLCNQKYSATQYALLSSAAALLNDTIVIYGGSLQQMLGWDYFFAMTIILALPGILVFVYLHKYFDTKSI